MSWKQCVIDIPMNDFSLERGIHAVAVADEVYLFGFKVSDDEDTVQVLAFNPATSSWRVPQPPEQGDGDDEDALDPTISYGKEIVIHFAVAFGERVFVCEGDAGIINYNSMKVFDTRSSRWSREWTSEDGPSEFDPAVHACGHNGHVYVCGDYTFRELTLWALDLSSFRWASVGTWKGDGFDYEVEYLHPHENRLYMLWTVWHSAPHYVVMYFDLATHTWEKLNEFDLGPEIFCGWIPFVFQETLYTLLREKPIESHGALSEMKDNEFAMKYSFASNSWVRMRVTGATPEDTLDKVCVVGKVAVFFSFTKKKAYVFDFLPSLSSLCFQAIRKYQLDASSLPTRLQRELAKY